MLDASYYAFLSLVMCAMSFLFLLSRYIYIYKIKGVDSRHSAYRHDAVSVQQTVAVLTGDLCHALSSRDEAGMCTEPYNFSSPRVPCFEENRRVCLAAGSSWRGAHFLVQSETKVAFAELFFFFFLFSSFHAWINVGTPNLSRLMVAVVCLH